MPTYEYECEACRHRFERVQKITEPPAKTCPKCRKRKVKRLITGGSFILKGDGWYADGYSHKPEKREKVAEGEKKPPESKASEKKGEATPKTETKKKAAGS